MFEDASIHEFDSKKIVRTNIKEYFDTTSGHGNKCIACAECLKP